MGEIWCKKTPKLHFLNQSSKLNVEKMLQICTFTCLLKKQKPGNSRPESSVDLRGAQLHWANELSSKKNVFKVRNQSDNEQRITWETNFEKHRISRCTLNNSLHYFIFLNLKYLCEQTCEGTWLKWVEKHSLFTSVSEDSLGEKWKWSLINEDIEEAVKNKISRVIL